ncbi:uncharacterized protein LOC133515918 [Cydia pomonella]|uniref:uncharacterized protein LOC133515918 n=1 Tax=Cydia pomonella TaxID=82600 RepID=UPI002ADDD72F|nr:uncharacterized protein LOC133515918 [Cydia pomonella]
MASKIRKRNGFSAASFSTQVVFCNIRGLHKNLSAVHYHLEFAQPTIVFLTDTQISCPADTSYLLYPGYTLEHKFMRHAGVCMFALHNVCCRRLHVLWVRVCHTRVYACLYRSHGGNTETTRLFEHLQLTTDRILEQYPCAELVILGDFNAHQVEWLGSLSTDHAERSAQVFSLAYGFPQLVHSPMIILDIEDHTSSLLDLLLTTRPDEYSVSVNAPLGSSDHCLVQTLTPCAQTDPPRPTSSRRVWQYKSADWNGLREFYASYPWRQLCFTSDDPDSCASSVAETILAAYKAWTKVVANKDPNVSDVKRKLNAALRSSKKGIARAKYDFVGRIGEKLAGYPTGSRAFWSFAKAAEGNFCQSSLPPLRKTDGDLAHSAKEKADLLGTLFASISTMNDDGSAVPPTIPQCAYCIPEISITQRDIRRELLSINVHKSSGPDGIPAVVLKQYAPEMCPVLARLFTLSSTKRHVPSSWMTALVHLMPKKGDRSDPSNYRSIIVLKRIRDLIA